LWKVSDHIIACCVLQNITVCDDTDLGLLIESGDCEEAQLEPTNIPAHEAMGDVASARHKRHRIAQQLLQPG